MNPLLLVTGLTLLLPALLQAEDLNDRFVRIYNLIQQADALNESGRDDQARQKYVEAQVELKTLRKTHPDWNESVVGFRLEYVAEKLKTFAPGAQRPAQTPPSKEPESPATMVELAGLVQLLQEQLRGLTADRELLQAKLKEALTAQPAAVDPRELAAAQEKLRALQKEVEVLKVNLEKAEAKPDKPVAPAVLEETRKNLTAANRKIEEQAEAIGALTLEKEALQARLRAFVDGTELQSLRAEKESLKGRVNELEGKLNQLSVRGNTNMMARLRSLDKELADARASAQSNVALVSAVQPAESGVVKAAAGPERPVSGSLPASAGPLLAEAERAFSARRYREAEEKYSQALRLDQKNVGILANLAAAQIEQNRLVQAEGNLKNALAGAPKDALSLSLLGVLKIRQQKFDEALDALSQAAQLDANNADVFQRLGIVLVEKGLRAPAESAFRRAIHLAPGNGDAHHNLAVIYASQQPPAIERARWHYQKALASGHPKDTQLEQMLNR